MLFYRCIHWERAENGGCSRMNLSARAKKCAEGTRGRTAHGIRVKFSFAQAILLLRSGRNQTGNERAKAYGGKRHLTQNERKKIFRSPLLYHCPYKAFYFVTSVCTVLLEIPNAAAAARTVALCAAMYLPSRTARSSGSPFMPIPPLRGIPGPAALVTAYAREARVMKEKGEELRVDNSRNTG